MLPHFASVVVKQLQSQSSWSNDPLNNGNNRPELGLFIDSELACVDFSNFKIVQWPFNRFSFLGAYPLCHASQ